MLRELGAETFLPAEWSPRQRYGEDLAGIDEVRIADLLAVGLVDLGVAQPLAIGVLGDAPEVVAGLNVDGDRAVRRRHPVEGDGELRQRPAAPIHGLEAQAVFALGHALMQRHRPPPRAVCRTAAGEPIVEIDIDARLGLGPAEPLRLPRGIVLDDVKRERATLSGLARQLQRPGRAGA